MSTPEILLLTGAGLAAAGLFALGVLVGMLISNRRADREYEQYLLELEQAELERLERLRTPPDQTRELDRYQARHGMQ